MHAKQAAGTAAAAVLLIAIALTGAVVDRAHGSSLRLLADTGGPIRQVAMSLTSARRANLHSAALVSALGSALAPDTELVALSNDPAAFSVQQDKAPNKTGTFLVSDSAKSGHS